MSDSTTINSNSLSAISLRSDLSDREGTEIKSGSEEGESPSNVLEEASEITLQSTVPALQTAYRKTFLQISTPESSLSRQELHKQLNPLVATIQKDIATKASVDAASGVLAIIEEADIADAKLLATDIQASYSEADSIYSQPAIGRTYDHSQNLGSEQVDSVSDIVYTNGIALGTSSVSAEDSSSVSEESPSLRSSTILPKLSGYKSGADSLSFNMLPNRQLSSTQQNRLFAIMAGIHHEMNPGSFQSVRTLPGYGLLNNTFSTAKRKFQAAASTIEADLKEEMPFIEVDFQAYKTAKETSPASPTNSSKDSSEEERELNDITNAFNRDVAQDDANEAELQSKEAIDRMLRDQQTAQQLQGSCRTLKELLYSPGAIAVAA